MITLTREITCHQREGGYRLEFFSMASPCEVLVDSADKVLVQQLGVIAADEAWRIEDKYSRYNNNSVCSHLNSLSGEICTIDDETYLLLKFAAQCYQMSDGLFDITSGILRKAWHFDCTDNIPSRKSIDKLMPFLSWQQVKLTNSNFIMNKGMEIDFGGLAKEYAVDRSLLLICDKLKAENKDIPVLVNFGGDLAVNTSRKNKQAWQVGIESPSLNNKGKEENRTIVVTLSSGAIASSGDARKFLLKDGIRYSHILNVKTGWPIVDAPHSVTIAAPQCVQAGFIATLASLKGAEAEKFLLEEDIPHWIIR